MHGAQSPIVAVPLLDLRAQYATVRDGVRAAIDRVCETQELILGAEVELLETEVARFLATDFGVGVSSGSDALLCALMALGIGAGDEVITTPFTFIATAEAIVRCGAMPRFVDIEPATMNLDPEQVAAAINPRTKAVLPVHLFGHPAELDPLAALARRHGVVIVEDAAQAFGAAYRGRKLGTWGILGCFSFFPSKPLGAFGDGGMIVTSDAGLAQRCRNLRSHGSPDKRTYQELGGNFRLDALQAAILRVKLGHVEHWLAARRAHALAYRDALGDLPGVVLPHMQPDSEPAVNLYTLRVRDGRRDALAACLRARGIQTAVHYPLPLHLQPCFRELGLLPGALPESENAAREVLSIPLYPELTAGQRDYVVDSIRGFFA
jgi:dTDP-4-amino-4,6-dideoxygalactose transaminase